MGCPIVFSLFHTQRAVEQKQDVYKRQIQSHRDQLAGGIKQADLPGDRAQDNQRSTAAHFDLDWLAHIMKQYGRAFQLDRLACPQRFPDHGQIARDFRFLLDIKSPADAAGCLQDLKQLFQPCLLYTSRCV